MDARQLIVQADEIRRDQDMTQAEWCRRAGFDEFGKLVSNTFRRGNCKMNVFLQLLRPLGYELRIVKQEERENELQRDADLRRTDARGSNEGSSLRD